LSVVLTWLGIAACLSQAATLSGLNLAVFSVSRLRLETASKAGDRDAKRVLALRRDANFTLATILWANVSANVLLALLADSVLAGVVAFLFSTVVLTLMGEILPQAYFSRNAIRVAARLVPLLRCYRILLWPLAKPVGKLLDVLVGPEGINWLQEKELREVLWHHAGNVDTEMSTVEAIGAINFLALDDVAVSAEGEIVDPRSIVVVPFANGAPVFPDFARDASDPFMRRLDASGKKWVIVVDEVGTPRLVLDAHAFLRDAVFAGDGFEPLAHSHQPLVVEDGATTLGDVLGNLTVHPEKSGDDVIDRDIILLWTPLEKRIITGSDILGRLLRGIAQHEGMQAAIESESAANGHGAKLPSGHSGAKKAGNR
jgi:metal transporter CNNM